MQTQFCCFSSRISFVLEFPQIFQLGFNSYGRFFVGGMGFALTDKSVGVLGFKYKSAGIVIT